MMEPPNYGVYSIQGAPYCGMRMFGAQRGGLFFHFISAQVSGAGRIDLSPLTHESLSGRRAGPSPHVLQRPPRPSDTSEEEAAQRQGRGLDCGGRDD